MGRSAIKNKITLLAVAATALALLVTLVFSSILTVVSSRTQTARELQTLAEVTAINNQASILFNDKAAALETLNALAVRKDVVSVEIIMADGVQFARKDFSGRSSCLDMDK